MTRYEKNGTKIETNNEHKGHGRRRRFNRQCMVKRTRLKKGGNKGQIKQ